MRLKLIACEVFYREMCFAVSRSPNQVDAEFLPKGLHDLGSKGMSARLKEILDRVDASKYEAVLLGYGLCNNGLHGLEAGSIPLVVPRAHDCITLFLGGGSRYLQYFNDHPGVYFKTSGWIERGGNAGELSQLSIQHQTGMDSTYEELVEKYGEDNAQFLYEQICQHTRNYGQFTFIEMGIEPDDSFEKKTREDADQRGWRFEKVQGDMALIQRLVDGPWNNQDFLTVPPRHTLMARYDDQIIHAELIP